MRENGFLEVIHKIILQNINRILDNTIAFNDKLYLFRTRRGCHTDIVEAKIRMQIAT